MAGDTDDIRERLEAIAEELADLALDALRAALEAGADKRPDEEKRLTQARRAVEKAAGLLKRRESDGF
jgi:phosphate uptake regulator